MIAEPRKQVLVGFRLVARADVLAGAFESIVGPHAAELFFGRGQVVVVDVFEFREVGCPGCQGYLDGNDRITVVGGGLPETRHR